MWHVTRDMWHVTCDPQGPTWALSGGVERGTNERPGIWSCDLWRRPLQWKEMSSSQGTDVQTYRQTHGHRDSMTESAQWADSVKILTFDLSIRCIESNSGNIDRRHQDQHWEPNQTRINLRSLENRPKKHRFCSVETILFLHVWLKARLVLAKKACLQRGKSM